MGADALPESVLRSLLERIRNETAAGNIRLIYLNRHTGVAADPAYLRAIAEIKRFLERWSADARFREWLAADPTAAAGAVGLSLDPAELKYLWDAETALATPIDAIPLPALRYRAFILEKLTHRNTLRANHPTMDPRFAAWRLRQIKRATTHLNPHTAGSIVHAPFCIELCQGCSVGCWFCGISAPRLEDIFRHTTDNAALFAGVIETFQGVFGAAAGRGFLYWATDPMDNPDYERFMVDFHDRTGAFPQTTTALALKDIARTRALLELSAQRGGMLDRFSLLSLAQLARVHQEFTADELLYVELVTQNREGHQPKAKAGRAMTGRAAGEHPGGQAIEGTIACVSGFLVNMVQRSVKLISPCQASDRWPLGYLVFGEGRFRTVGEFRDLVHRLVDEHMYPTLRGDEGLSFQEHLRPEVRDDGLGVAGTYYQGDFGGDPVFAAVGRVLGRDRMTTDDLVDAVAESAGVSPAEALYAVNLLFAEGVLDPLPRAPSRPTLEVVTV